MEFQLVTLLMLLGIAIHHVACGRLRLSESQITPFKNQGPYSIAHRGACGEFPESSAPGFKRAIDEGIDIIETDIGSTKDGVLICLHDPTLDNITDVAEKFVNRKSTYEVEGQNITGYFAVDFTWKEIQTLNLRQRYDYRDQSYNGLYKIITFDEYLEIAQNAKNRTVGIFPEIKNPVFINQHISWDGGRSVFEDKFVEVLLKYGYDAPFLSENWLRKPVFIQTFAPLSILRIANQTKSPKIFNIGLDEAIAQGTNQTYLQLRSDEYLDFISQFVVGIATFKNQIAPRDSSGKLIPSGSTTMDRARARGLLVFLATFYNEAEFIARDFLADPYREFEYFLGRKIGADGLMTDYPASLASYMRVAGKNLFT